MNMKKLVSLALSALLIFSLAACQKTPSPAQSNPDPGQSAPKPSNDAYPSKPITCIVPYTAGGGTDVICRMMSSMFPQYIDNGQSLIVENQPGGAAVPGTLAVADADSDGYTIGYNWGAAWVLRPFIMDTGYEFNDFTLICGVEVQHNGIYVNADSPFQTLDDLVQYMLAHPGEMNYSTGPAASYQELVANAFLSAVGGSALNVPYEGARQAALGMMSGELDFTILQATTYSAELPAGSVRMLCSFEDSTYMEGVPTAAECGYPDLTFVHRSMIYGPDGMSDDAVAKIEAAFEKLCSDETFLKLAANSQADIQFVSHDEIVKQTLEQAEASQEIIDKTMK